MRIAGFGSTNSKFFQFPVNEHIAQAVCRLIAIHEQTPPDANRLVSGDVF